MATGALSLVEQLRGSLTSCAATSHTRIRHNVNGKPMKISVGATGLHTVQLDIASSRRLRGNKRVEASRLWSRRRSSPRATSGGPGSTSDTEEASKEELATKLAEAEAEAAALRQELANRRAGTSGDLAKLKPAKPEKRIDGTGFRETILGARGGTGRAEQQMAKWGLSEAEIFAPKEEGAVGQGELKSAAFEDGAASTIRRRLIIGLALTAVTIAASLVKLPTQLGKPSKPLFFYLVPLVKLQSQLEPLTKEDTVSDLGSLTLQLKAAVGPTETLKENLLSAASLYDSNQDVAERLAFEILEYLDQADYKRYFENRGQPSATQQAEFLRFSLESIKAAYNDLGKVLKLAPPEALEAAKLQLASQFGV